MAIIRGGRQKGRQQYIEVKWVSEEWWFVLLWIWLGISSVVITLAMRYNILHGWNCPKHCGAFLTPFTISLSFLFLACCVCCPMLGANGVWWCTWKRKSDQPKTQLHRISRRCCCIACSWSADVKLLSKRIGKPICETNELPTATITSQELYNQTKTRVDRKRQHEAQSIDRSQHPVSVSAATSGHAGNYTAFSSEPILEARAGATTGTQYSNDSATPSLEYNKLPAHRTMAQNVQSGRIGSL